MKRYNVENEFFNLQKTSLHFTDIIWYEITCRTSFHVFILNGKKQTVTTFYEYLDSWNQTCLNSTNAISKIPSSNPVTGLEATKSRKNINNARSGYGLGK